MTKTYGVIILSVTELAVTVLVLLWLGSLADTHFDAGSLYTSIGAVAGCILGFIRLIVRLKALMNDDNAQS
ncbi:MAG: hypothetical protein SGI74_07215 [Oligoflexia bacterium]|nr:hypothetical protein [Oligoflexia bacterium]